MNNGTTNVTAAALDGLIQQNYEIYLSNLTTVNIGFLLLYATLLNLGQEIESIWLKRFSWPTLLYIFTRYGALICVAFWPWFFYVQPLGRAPQTVLTSGEDIFRTFSFIGVQGLLVARAYSLIGGNGILSKFLVFLLLLGTVLFLTVNIKIGANPNGTYILLPLLVDVNIIAIELFVFAVCMWKIWGVWRFSRQAGIRDSSSIASVLVKQGVLRCCFVIVVTVVIAITSYVFPNSILWNCLTLYQNALSSIIMAGFTLELRRQNSASIEARNISLSSIRFSNILENIHQSILVEMASPDPEVEGPNVADHVVDGNHNGSPVTVNDIQSA